MSTRAVAGALALLLLLAACGQRRHDGVEQTKMPGEITAGGRTSGEVMAANNPGGAVEPGPAGTPGIPRGAEGNTGGTAMGGTTGTGTPGATGSAQAPAGGAAAASAAQPPAAAASTPAQIEAAVQQKALVASMDAVAARWRGRAAAQGWHANAATPTDHAAGIQASAIPTPTPPPMPLRSEKAGTAPASADVKQPVKPPSDPGVGAKAPDAAGHRP